MAIYFFNEDVDFKISYRLKCKSWIKNVAVRENKKVGNINIIFCSDSLILDINNKYLNHNYFTDVITFDYSKGNTINGEIYISTDTVFRNSVTYICSFEQEIYRVIVHGVLHLIGYNDSSEEEKDVMRNLEDLYLELLYSLFLL